MVAWKSFTLKGLRLPDHFLSNVLLRGKFVLVVGITAVAAFANPSRNTAPSGSKYYKAGIYYVSGNHKLISRSLKDLAVMASQRNLVEGT